MTKNYLFTTDQQLELGLGYHNVGTGVLRFAHADVVKKIEKIYGQRCGHIPLDAKTAGVLVEYPDDETHAQMTYLSDLFDKKLVVMTPSDLKQYTVKNKGQTLVAPYISVPEADQLIKNLGSTMWGLPPEMTHKLKNKTEFYNLVRDLDMPGFEVPDYRIVQLEELLPQAKKFLHEISGMYSQVGLKKTYPLGIMLRASDEDGNYGSSLLHEKGEYIIMVPDGDTERSKLYGNWNEALLASLVSLKDAMDTQKESRVVMSRYIDMAESPGLSLVILDGKVFSLGWNGQLQIGESKACVGTSSFVPRTKKVEKLQKKYEAETVRLAEAFMRATAKVCNIDFSSLRAVVNFDIMLLSEKEMALQKKRGRTTAFYLAECNPRWTNYTDAVLTVMAAEKLPQTVESMKKVIKKGISTIDKYWLPRGLDPQEVRKYITLKDQKLQKEGTRLICRMAKSPMGLILSGDIVKAEREMQNIIAQLSQKNNELSQYYTRKGAYQFAKRDE